MPTYQFLNETAPSTDAVAITPNDSADLPTQQVKSLYIGSVGTLAVVTAQGTTINFASLFAGQVIPLVVRRVLATGTTVTGIVGLL